MRDTLFGLPRGHHERLGKCLIISISAQEVAFRHPLPVSRLRMAGSVHMAMKPGRLRETSEPSTRFDGGGFHTNTPLLSERIIRRLGGRTTIEFREGFEAVRGRVHTGMSAG